MSYQEEAEAEEQPFQVDNCSMILLAAALGAAAEGPTCFCGYFFPLLLLVWWSSGVPVGLLEWRGRGKTEKNYFCDIIYHLSLSRSLCLTRASERRSEPFTQNEDESRVVLICYVSIIYRPCAVHNVNITYHIPPRILDSR